MASLESPGLAPVVGVITPQLKNGSTRNLAGESGWKRISRRKRTRNYREFQRATQKIGRAVTGARAGARDWRIRRSQVLGRILFAIKKSFHRRARREHRVTSKNPPRPRCPQRWMTLLEAAAAPPLLSAPYADVFKSHSAQPHGIEQVLRIHNDGLFEQVLNPVKIERAELRPARAHHQRVHALRCRVS
jgi:hypothetical protein